MNKKIINMVYTALFTSIVAIVTLAIPFPSPAGGFYNIGDSMVMIAGLFLGPIGGAVAGGLGSALADFFLGYGAWVPWTFVIKGLEGFIIGFLAHKGYHSAKKGNTWLIKFLPAAIIGVVVMVGGYWIAYGIMSGSFAAAAVEIPGNIIQGVLSIIIATTLGIVLRTKVTKGSGR